MGSIEIKINIRDEVPRCVQIVTNLSEVLLNCVIFFKASPWDHVFSSWVINLSSASLKKNTGQFKAIFQLTTTDRLTFLLSTLGQEKSKFKQTLTRTTQQQNPPHPLFSPDDVPPLTFPPVGGHGDNFTLRNEMKPLFRNLRDYMCQLRTSFEFVSCTKGDYVHPYELTLHPYEMHLASKGLKLLRMGASWDDLLIYVRNWGTPSNCLHSLHWKLTWIFFNVQRCWAWIPNWHNRTIWICLSQ